MFGIPARTYICDRKDFESLKKTLEYDPYLDKSKTDEELAKLKEDAEANVIFARQDYWLKDGIVLGLDREKCYLTISSTDDFLEKAESKLKKLYPELKRADSDLEQKIVGEIEKERSESEQGLGMIFG